MFKDDNFFIGNLFSRGKHFMNAYVNERVKKYNISSVHVSYIFMLHNAREATQSQITQMLGFDKANSSRVLAELENKKLLIRKQTDGKVFCIPTPECDKLAIKIKEIFAEWRRRVFKGITEEEFEVFHKVIQTALKNSRNLSDKDKDKNNDFLHCHFNESEDEEIND